MVCGSRTIWLYLRFTLSYHDVEELLAERGFDIPYETVRRWLLKFGPLIARRRRQASPSAERPLTPRRRWWCGSPASGCICGVPSDHEDEVLDMLVQRRRNTRAALRLMSKLLKRQGFASKLLATD
jgi:transposase-like protein